MTLTKKKHSKKIIIIYDNLCAKLHRVTGKNLGLETHQNYLQFISNEFNSYLDLKKDFKSCILYIY